MNIHDLEEVRTLVCRGCNEEFTTTSRIKKRCDSCQETFHKDKIRKRDREKRLKLRLFRASARPSAVRLSAAVRRPPVSIVSRVRPDAAPPGRCAVVRDQAAFENPSNVAHQGRSGPTELNSREAGF